MSQLQYGSFEIQSLSMKEILQTIENNRHKKYFIIVGEPGSGKSTMMDYINKIVFSGTQKNLIEDEKLRDNEISSAIVTTGKESAYEFIKRFESKETLIIEMPPLEDRKADIIPFAQFFIQVLSLMNNKKPHKLTDKAIEKLLQYNWPGHFHELEAVLEQAFDNAQSAELKATIEPEHINLNLPTKGFEFSIGQKLDEVERKYILQTLYFVHQNRTRAAEILGISIRTLRNKISQYREEGYL
jgi:ABC-type cobalamin/Fe3+-siderophores transport system ATPase subunit